MNRIRETYNKHKDSVSENSTRYYYHSEIFNCTIHLLYQNGKLWTANIESMQNIYTECTHGKWIVKQEHGNSTKEEFLEAYKIASEFLINNINETDICRVD